MTREKAARGFFFAGQPVQAPPLASGLYLVATPIGNLADISLRALQTLAGADVIACEDSRVTRKLLDNYGVKSPLTPYHEHNAAQARPRLLARLQAGEAVALVSDAGTPLISDPGFKLVQAAKQAQFAVTSVPGPSAALTALTISGLPSAHFFFEGFLPPKSGARRARIAELARIPGSLILFESGPRLPACLAELSQVLGPRQATICRELTKLHEETRQGSLEELASHYAGDAETRGEIVIVIAPPASDAASMSDERVDALIRGALQRSSMKDAVSEVSAATGIGRREIYQRALTLQNGNDGNDGDRR